MILTCPSCDTRYMLDIDSLRPEGQIVRCFKCKHVWVQDPSKIEDEGATEDIGEDIGGDIAEDDEPIDLESFEPRPVDRETDKPIEVKPRSKIDGIINWVLFCVIFGGAITSAIIYRDVVREIWPVSSRLYTLIGLGVEVPGAGFELRNIQSKRTKKDGVPSLTISGEIANVSRKVRVVPIFSGELTNSAGESLHSWTFTIPQKNLLPGESVTFKTVTSNLPKGTAGLNITFLAPETMTDKEEMTEEGMSSQDMSTEE